MRLFYIISISLICPALFAQKQDNIWVLGRGGGNQTPFNDQWGAVIFDFSTSISPMLIERQDYDMNMGNTNASISDSLGNLLFYTNSEKIYNRNVQAFDGKLTTLKLIVQH